MLCGISSVRCKYDFLTVCVVCVLALTVRSESLMLEQIIYVVLATSVAGFGCLRTAAGVGSLGVISLTKYFTSCATVSRALRTEHLVCECGSRFVSFCNTRIADRI